MTSYPARILLKFTSQRFQRRFSSSNSEGAGGQKQGHHQIGTFEWDTTHINSDGFSNASNSRYMEFLYGKWIQDEKSIHESWQKFFGKLVINHEKEPEMNILSAEKMSRKNFLPNTLDSKRDFGYKKNNSNNSKNSIEDGKGSFGFSPIPGHKKVSKSDADKEGVNRPDKSGEKPRASPKPAPGQSPLSKYEETEDHYFPMPIVLDPSSHIDVSETSFMQDTPNIPELGPGWSVKEPESYENGNPTSSFESKIQNIQKSISRKLSQGTTSKEPPKPPKDDSKSLKDISKTTKSPNDVTQKSKQTSISLKKDPPIKDKPSTPQQSPTPSKEVLDVASQKSVTQQGVLDTNKTTASMTEDKDQHKVSKPPLNPSNKIDKKNDDKKGKSPKKEDATPHPKQDTATPIAKVKFEDVVEINPAIDRFQRQPLKIPKKSIETNKPSVKRNKKQRPPPRKGNIHPVTHPNPHPSPIAIPPLKPESSSLKNPKEIVKKGRKHGSALENWKRTYKKKLLESLLRRLENKPRKVSKDDPTNRRSFKSIKKYTEPKVFEGIEQLIKDLDTMPWGSTTKQKRLDTMKRLKSYNNSLKSANETLRRLANERNIAFMKSVLAHRQNLLDAKSKRIKKDSSNDSEGPSLNATLRNTPSVHKVPEMVLQDSPPQLGLTEREKIILFDRNQEVSTALRSSLKKLEDSKSKVLIGKLNINTEKETPSPCWQIKEKTDDAKPENKPKSK